MAEQDKGKVEEKPVEAAPPVEKTPPATAAPPAEKAVEGPPPPPAAAKAKDIAAVARMRSEVLREKEQARTAVARANEFVARAEADFKARMDRVEAKERELTEKLDAIKRDPANAFKALGWDKEEYFKRVLSDGKASPESLASEAVKEAKAAREELAAFKAENARLAKEAEQRAAQARSAGIIDQFAGYIVAHPSDFPYLVRMHDQREIAAQTREIVDWARGEGHTYSDEEVAGFLEHRAQERYKRIQEAEKTFGPTKGAVTETAEATEPVSGTSGSSPREQRGAASKPNGKGGKLTEAEEDEKYLRLLREATAKDAKARAAG